MRQQKLPIGIDDFAELRREAFYYVDKTNLIKELLENWCKVSLFTRPRRFGKTLNMSMLRRFFEIGADAALFDGLAIAEDMELCRQYLGQFPVIFISLKDVDGADFEAARRQMWKVIRDEARRYSFLGESEKLDPESKADLQALRTERGNLEEGLEMLSGLLRRHYEKKTIILIDEYDVPLERAYQRGYYEQMVLLLRQMFGYALKSNENLQFAVLTGCLRISKESIFTGLNNFLVSGMTDVAYDENFGFTDAEVRHMLQEYGYPDHYELAKEWYDGYHFGNQDVYCPWDVVNYVRSLVMNPDAQPQDFWINTSGNDMVRRFVEKADSYTRFELEQLVAGGIIRKRLRMDLTYGELESSIDNLWSVLFTTGYLTQCGRDEDGLYLLKIPNQEVREIFTLQIQEWFAEELERDSAGLKTLCRAFELGNETEIEEVLNKYLSMTISILDAKAPSGKKENFYHGLLLGMLRSREDWNIVSNVEAGNGFADIIVYSTRFGYGFVIEVKYADGFSSLEQCADRGLQQIRDKCYSQYLVKEGIGKITSYGIAFFKKNCRVRKESC